MADLVGVPEEELWPEVRKRDEPAASALPAGIKKVYPHRWEVPQSVWRQFFESAEREIGVLVYSGLFLADDTGILRIFERKAREGVKVRLLLGNPDSPHVEERGREEGIGEAMSAKIRNALVLYRPLLKIGGIELRLHGTVLYNSIYRADTETFINPHAYGTPASSTPIFHLEGDSNIGRVYQTAFETIWNTSY
ncbi:XRE family transcriptional regulator [Streptomonospora salina]|uniref:XRE family transcriptional regulator n=1 Tax=Streptomonospora salina TaxID=104205 RepID=A0A841EGF5_9ACTN|nr:XRE family transcriptional regulator [Streptomonospora salina]MBB5998501.1 hypothetical protein [Streptomonospora salina]